eukprot:CAMPEP_0171129186 /NCGR_PEP_ID=MMETSP0766_2-20121228/118454_1 /TAXON_ID=439317 /ORGANISM="Gambierdiscus australes, Strain CAWD 149" /LENGTH=76 /DNA_ID=CAMNT_0011592375 /DNA_START=48 /DNA_END=274 /DNA_ORIENTATION=-
MSCNIHSSGGAWQAAFSWASPPSLHVTGTEGGGLGYSGGSASTSKAWKSFRAWLLATASLKKLRQSSRCSQVSMCT